CCAAATQARRPGFDPHRARRGLQAAGGMTSLRGCLFQAIIVVVVLCVGLTVAVGLALTRRAVDRGALRDLSHQADLIAGSQGIGASVTPHPEALRPYLDKQDETFIQTA